MIAFIDEHRDAYGGLEVSEAMVINRKKTQRLYSEEKLAVRRRRNRRRAIGARAPAPVPVAEAWAGAGIIVLA